MTGDVEDAFSEHICNLQDILLLAKVFVSNQTNVVGSASRVGSLSTDWGIIFPLTMTALKCRMGSIREEAVALLEAYKHREGFWDSALAARCCRELVSLELSNEGGTVHPLANIWVDIPDHQREVALAWESNGPSGTPAHSRAPAI